MESKTEGTRSLVLDLPARPENVAVVRHALAGLADTAGMDPVAIGDLKTVVTEACMNVVEHAYDEVGPLEVRAETNRDELSMVIRDKGRGMRPRVGGGRPSLRIGLALIASLSTRFQIAERPGGGTELRITVPFVARDTEEDEESGSADPIADETVITVPAGDLVAPVLTRVVSMLATRADFSVDRLSDTMLVSDAIGAQQADGFVDGIARIVVFERQGKVAVRVGPLHEGGGQQLLEMMRIPELDLTLETLADEISVEGDGEGEELRLVFGPRSG